MREPITLEEFRTKDRAYQSAYIQDRLNLSRYLEIAGDCSREEAGEGRRLIGYVTRTAQNNGRFTYFVYPIDCLNMGTPGTGRENVLFQTCRLGFPIPKNDAASIKAAEEAFGSGSGARGDRMVTGEYIFTDMANQSVRMPIQMANIHVLDLSPSAVAAKISRFSFRRVELDKSLKELEQQHEELARRLETAAARLTAEEEALKQAQQRRREETQRLDQAQTAASSLNAAVRRLADDMRRLGFPLDVKALGLDPELPLTEGNLSRKASVKDLSGLVRRTQNILSREYALYYEDHVIREFLGAMFSNQLIILSGPPGTGKSSLPPAIAGCIGAQCRIVSVQPSWTDNQDLLGFYNPTQERFAATPFMDILIEAARDPHTIYLVCLDEMNLVRVEYYFSEILSAMETRDKELRLYSPHTYELRVKALARQISAFHKRSGDQEWQEAAEKLAALSESLRYKAVFPLPANVQFVGTLNMDESTRELSPKVLDRSFIIEVGRAAAPKRTEEAEEIERDAYAPSAFQNIQGGLSEAAAEEQMDKLERLLRQIEELGDSRQVNALLSRRGQAQVKTLFRRGLELDDILLGKIMPVLNYAALERDKLSDQLEAHRPDLKNSLDKLARMYDQDMKELNYWR